MHSDACVTSRRALASQQTRRDRRVRATGGKQTGAYSRPEISYSPDSGFFSIRFIAMLRFVLKCPSSYLVDLLPFEQPKALLGPASTASPTELKGQFTQNEEPSSSAGSSSSLVSKENVPERSHIQVKPLSEEAAECDAAGRLTGDKYAQTWWNRCKSPKLCLIGTWRRGGGGGGGTIKARFLEPLADMVARRSNEAKRSWDQ